MLHVHFEIIFCRRNMEIYKSKLGKFYFLPRYACMLLVARELDKLVRELDKLSFGENVD